MRFGRRRALTAAQQFVNLRGNSVCRGDGVLQVGRFTWRYSAMPSPLSRDYDIRIEFNGWPEIFVERPDLHVLAGGRRIPHLYEQEPPRLCLYYQDLRVAIVDAARPNRRAVGDAVALLFRGMVRV